MWKNQQESVCIIISPVVTRGYGRQGTYTASSWHFGDQDRACSAPGLLCDCSTCDVEEGLLSHVGSTQWYCLAGWAITITLEDLGCWSCEAWSWPSSCFVSPTCSSCCRAVPPFFSFFLSFPPHATFSPDSQGASGCWKCSYDVFATQMQICLLLLTMDWSAVCLVHICLRWCWIYA